MQRADLTNACNLKNLKRADAERAVDKAKERLAKVFGIKVVFANCSWPIDLYRKSDCHVTHIHDHIKGSGV